jgi:hypothetical protein
VRSKAIPSRSCDESSSKNEFTLLVLSPILSSPFQLGKVLMNESSGCSREKFPMDGKPTSPAWRIILGRKKLLNPRGVKRWRSNSK